ncbi:putative prolyl oligopeptidase family protein [Lyophyllum shimeji]|uniref:Prolyl oligopeptidase family protein n=1 Tax=Lyophyllum shimeji TaxID=47721 RepID=A0A9P3PGR9_LYOSH|nr:putative prolyl oligopeptidase family protein [Lyophyllum shimeji]
MSVASQTVLAEDLEWKIELNRIWDVLGPFPIHAREQHYLSPSFPLNLSEPIDLTHSWPSSYADHGKVHWSTAEMDANDVLSVSFPDIRWHSLRATEGWAALQHHAVLRGTLTVHPPSSGHESFPRLLVNLVQGSFFTILPANAAERRLMEPEWYAGNIYDMERALPRAVPLPVPPYLKQPTIYHLFVSGDYEIRLFGDPAVQGSEIPVQTIRLTVELESVTHSLVHEPSQGFLCDFVDGMAFGNALGITLRSISGWWTVSNATAHDAKITLTILRDTVIAPSQTRVVPLLLAQKDSFHLPTLEVDLAVTSDEGVTRTIAVTVPVTHQSRWTPSFSQPIKATYINSSSIATAFLVVPPILQSPRNPYPPIVALHGAGVDIFGQPFWTQSIPRNKHGWLVFPSGRTSWGLDWHGPSARDVWTAVDALFSILQSNKDWKRWQIGSNPRVVLVGHSNGGQGAWYLASRYPDRVLGVLPAAAYIKSQAYVPLTMSRSGHYIDPALRAILESSLTPDDNDLHLSNLVDTPILAIHGGNDSNVPVWHSREAVSILQTLGARNVTLKEDEGQDHWYSTLFDNDRVQNFLNSLLTKEPSLKSETTNHFTLTVSDPDASGSLRGWKIESLLLPGRLARLYVNLDGGGFAQVRTSNVKSFSLDHRLSVCRTAQIGDSLIRFSPGAANLTYFTATGGTAWEARTSLQHVTPHPQYRVQSILSFPDSILFIVSNDTKALSIALRLSNDLLLYHRLDSEIMPESKAQGLLKNARLPRGNIVYVGDARSLFVQEILSQKRTAFDVKGSVLELNGQTLDASGTAAAFLHPHPVAGQTGNSMLFLLGNSPSSLERIARLFPIRTGVATPSWVVTSALTDSIGAAGIRGAGVWGQEWEWNEALSIWVV